MIQEEKQVSDRLVWADIETTGTGDHDIMLEVAVIVTDNDLKEIARFSSLVIDCDPRDLIPSDRPRTKDSDIPCWSQHFESGLVQELIEEFDRGEFDHTVRVVEDGLVRFLNGYGVYEGMDPMVPLCGSSVHFDRRFLRRRMPRMMELLHYRNIDVSGIRECARRWSTQLEIPEVDAVHRAVDDLRNSIALLKFFRESGFLGV